MKKPSGFFAIFKIVSGRNAGETFRVSLEASTAATAFTEAIKIIYRGAYLAGVGYGAVQ